MKKKNFIISSIITIALCMSMIVGSTFALFTSESKVNIAVTSGKVSVVANIDENSVQTKQLYDTQYEDGKDNMYEGVATFNADGLTLEKFVPGDGIKFNIVVNNESNVTVKYRTIISCENDNGLFAGLLVNIADKQNYDGKEHASKWELMSVGAQDIIVPVTIELPENAGNTYQEKTCTISYMVEAVQGNAETSDDALAGTFNEFVNAINSGKPVTLTNDIIVPENVDITANAVVNGNGNEIKREDGYTGNIFTVKAGYSLALNDVIIDGGAIWEEQVATFSLRASDSEASSYGVQNKVNNGVTATGALIATEGNAVVTLGEDVILKNNDGANAVSLATRGGGKLIINGAKIINNRSGAGAIYGGSSIEFNDGEISGNHATWAGGAIRFVNNFGTFVMNGGKMNYNTSDTYGGAIYLGSGSGWDFKNSEIYLNGGEIAYNRATTTGGVIQCAGMWGKVSISGDVEIHDNTSADLGAVVRFNSHCMLIMDGGKVYNNVTDNGHGAFYAWNVSISLLGGEIYNDTGADIDYEISTDGGLGQLYGATKLDCPITLTVSQNVKTISLAEGFNFSFKINSTVDGNTLYTFVPYEGYEYIAGDENKIVCMNDGFVVEWNETDKVFVAHMA